MPSFNPDSIPGDQTPATISWEYGDELYAADYDVEGAWIHVDVWSGDTFTIPAGAVRCVTQWDLEPAAGTHRQGTDAYQVATKRHYEIAEQNRGETA